MLRIRHGIWELRRTFENPVVAVGFLSVSVFGCGLFAQVAQKSSAPKAPEADMCAAPPGDSAPSLPAKLMEGQGVVHFAITTSNPKAQKFFDQGVAQMHSFWAREAERSFLQAAELDPDAPMPWWGIAMVAAGDYRPRHQLEAQPAPKNAGKQEKAKTTSRWGASGTVRAVDAAEKAERLAAVPGKAKELEKLYIAAIAARRGVGKTSDAKAAGEKNSSGAPITHDQAYIAGLRKILAIDPDQVEAASYLALHLMRGFTSPGREPREGSMESVQLLQTYLKKFPDHPGLHHYVIHAYEGSSFAKDAWTSCARYPELVPNIPHALHMPGHIYAQTGKWEEARKSFSDAAQNELGYMHADALYGRFHYGHNVHFEIVAQDFLGDYAGAMVSSKSLLELTENPREAAELDNPYTAYRQGWFGMLRTLVFFEKWDEILEGKLLPVLDKPREQAWTHWARGLAYANKGDAENALSEQRRMVFSLRELEQKSGSPVPKELETARMELDGHVAAAAGQRAKALQLFADAAHSELNLRYSEPPHYPRPVLDVLGRNALEWNNLTVAEKAFREELDQYPGYQRAQAALEETLRRKNEPVVAVTAH